jgi:transposase-like protein
MKGNEVAREQMLALFENDEAVKNLRQKTVQEVLETEMNEAPGACKGERTEWRRGCRKHLKSPHLLERLNQEFRRRTHIVRLLASFRG